MTQRLCNSLDLDSLLDERRWLLDLASALVGKDVAEDLVQDTLVTALEKPPREVTSLRAWSAGQMSRTSGSSFTFTPQGFEEVDRSRTSRRSSGTSTPLTCA